MDGSYEYGNTRLKAMKAGFFTRSDYANWISLSSINGLISALSQTSYKPDVEHALLRYPERLSVSGAVRNHVARTIAALRTFYRAEALQDLDLYLLRFDIFNLKTILRGQVHKAPADEILAHLAPTGELDDAACAELARQPDLRSTLNLLRTWSLPYAHDLLEAWPLYLETGSLAVLELALERFRYKRILGEADPEKISNALKRMLTLEIDAANILACIILVSERLPVSREQAENIFISGPGLRISFDKIMELANANNLEALVASLQNTQFHSPLQEALLTYMATGDITIFQRALESFLMRNGETLFRMDPLGSGVPIGFILAAESEAANLRVIAEGIQADLRPTDIWNQLLIPFEGGRG